MRLSLCALGATIFAAQFVGAQRKPIAYVPTAGVAVSGSLSVDNGKVAIGNNGTVTAGDSTAQVKLARGGDLRVCASTKVNLSRDTSVADAADSALMIALDRGAVEASYQTGKYSDVLLTPDLRILISGPGTADLNVRVNEKGDTCVDNHGANAPYVTVTSQFEGGVYRVQPNQRVMFEHGSLQQVVDNESEPCGCPAAAPVAVASNAAAGTTNTAVPDRISAANPFPLAQSEGLAKAPAAPVKPVVPVGVAHAEVEAPITYDAAATPNPAVQGAAGKEPNPRCGIDGSPSPFGKTVDCVTVPPGTHGVDPAATNLNAQISPVPPAKPHRGFFHSVGHFFAKVFGD